MQDFEETIGGGGRRDRERGDRGDRGDRGGLFSMLPSFLPQSILPQSLLGYGGERDQGDRGRGQRQLGRGSQGMDDTSPMLMGDPTGGDIALAPLAPLLDLMPAVPPIAIRVDVEETKDKYNVVADVAGLSPKDLKVSR
jgi:hypothetical protein